MNALRTSINAESGYPCSLSKIASERGCHPVAACSCITRAFSSDREK